jgi:hypothetical protein
MQNFGKIKNAFNDILAEFIVDKNAEKKKIVKRYLRAISESKILKSQFLIYNNIENRVDEDKFSANLFVTENINILKKFPKEAIELENKKLLNMSQMVLERLEDVYPHNVLHESISTLIFTDPTPNTIKKITESRMSVINFINENKEKVIVESDDILPNSLLLNISVDKFNEKYADLTEAEHKVLNVIMGSNNEEDRREIYTETLKGCITLVNLRLKESSNKEKLLDVKDKLLNSSFISESFDDDITKLLDLQRALGED